jgi:hypothetical protein
MYSFVHSKSGNRLGANKAEALVYIYTNSKLPRQRPGADPVRWYNNIFSKDSDPDDNGHETESEWNDDDGDDDDGIFGPLGGQIPGANEVGAEQAPNNNADGRNLEAFDWDGFLDDGTVGGAYPRNRSLMPSGDGGAHDIQSSEDYDEVCSGDDGSNGNVRNKNDDDRDDNVQNDEETPNNVAVGGDVQAALQEL